MVHMNIEVFDLESTSSCGYDSLLLAGGANASDLLCGNTSAGYDYVTDGNVATVTFHTDGSVTRQGFSMLYEAIPG